MRKRVILSLLVIAVISSGVLFAVRMDTMAHSVGLDIWRPEEVRKKIESSLEDRKDYQELKLLWKERR